MSYSTWLHSTLLYTTAHEGLDMAAAAGRTLLLLGRQEVGPGRGLAKQGQDCPGQDEVVEVVGR